MDLFIGAGFTDRKPFSSSNQQHINQTYITKAKNITLMLVNDSYLRPFSLFSVPVTLTAYVV